MVVTGGVVSNLVTFHWSASGKVAIFFASHVSFSTLSGLYTSSEMAGMLLRFTELTRETRVTAKVALRRGSSQQGNALLAAVGCSRTHISCVIISPGKGTSPRTA